MQARSEERKQINMCTTHGQHRNSSVQAVLLKCSTGLHGHQKELQRVRLPLLSLPLSHSMYFGFPLLAGALYSQTSHKGYSSSQAIKGMILPNFFFLFQLICSPARHDVVFCNEIALPIKLLPVMTCYTSVAFLIQALLHCCRTWFLLIAKKTEYTGPPHSLERLCL